MKYPPRIRQRHHGEASEEQLRAGWVNGPPRVTAPVELSEPDPGWPERFEVERQKLLAVLGPVALSVEHVGSTAVPDLVAKPIVDIDLVVAESDDETAYLPALISLEYRLVLREPWWWEHRMLVNAESRVNLHVFGRDAAEPLRHILFRDWLRSHPLDRRRYGNEKKRLAATTAENPHDYNLAKNKVIDDIYSAIWAEDDADSKRGPIGTT